VQKTVSRIEWDLDAIERGGYAHFMLRRSSSSRRRSRTRCAALLLDEGFTKLGGLNISREDLLKIDNIVITACGTSWHSALIGEMMIEELCRIPVEVGVRVGVPYRNPIVNDRTLCIVISQSGETADTLAAMREAKRPRRAHARHRERGGLDDRAARTTADLPARGPRDRRRVDQGVHEPGGRARAVHAQAGAPPRPVGGARARDRAGARGAPAQVQQILDRAGEIEALREEFKRASNFLYLGRGFNFPTALEGALKLKEISYIHAEGYPAAEMKHGPIALIDELMPCVVVAPHDSVFDKVVSNIQEVKARKGR
jgi:glucosamine--fructose-6-phosphate aminotransferase (isomerizing)